MKKKYIVPVVLMLLCSCKGADKQLVGSWVQPIPGQQESIQGVRLEAGGKASSINMYTLVYESWEQKGNNLILAGKSIGNGQEIDFSDTLFIKKLLKDTLVLDRNGFEQVYTRQHTP